MPRIIGIIGCGNMGSAIILALRPRYSIWAFDKDVKRTKDIKGINIADNAIDLVGKAETVILAIKPQDFELLLGQVKEYIMKKLIVSIAAGISTRYLESRLGKVRIVRVMPNLPAKIKKGITCLCKGSYSDNTDLIFVQGLFSNLGQTMLIKEELMNAATAISGSGPGFFYRLIQSEEKNELYDYAQRTFIPALSASAEQIGFSNKQADLLARETTMGSIALFISSGLSPLELERQVASKGGTTEAGLSQLHGIDSLSTATAAALKRAEELSR